MNAEIAGALVYRLVDAGLHIVALATDPMWQRSGVGGYLVAEAELLARRLGIPRVIVSMTNDNLPSLYFYQRRGYLVSEWIPNGAAKLSTSVSIGRLWRNPYPGRSEAGEELMFVGRVLKFRPALLLLRVDQLFNCPAIRSKGTGIQSAT